jgi:tetratricopeptide (TPR) repeat protein
VRILTHFARAAGEAALIRLVPVRRCLGILALATATVSLALPASAAQDAMGPPRKDKGDKKEETTERKSLGWFSHKPVKESPAEELAYTRQLEQEGHDGNAEDEYLALVRKWPDAAEAPVAQLSYAKLLDRRKKYEEAFEEYQYLIDHYAGCFPYAEVLDSQFKIALLVMNERSMTFWGLFPGFRAPESALPLLEKLVANGPGWERTPEARFHIGAIREEQGEYLDAVRAFEEIQQRHPRSPYAIPAAFHRAYCLFKEAEDNARDERRCRNALAALAAYVAEHPDSENAAEAKRCLDTMRTRLGDMYFDRAVFYDEVARRPKSALIAYTDFAKKFPNAGQTARARERIEALKERVKDED